MTPREGQRTWSFPHYMLTEFTAFTALVWIAYVVVIAAITIGIATFADLDQSIWDTASRIAPWYAAGIGGYVAYNQLPLHVTHGQTRRDFAIQAAIFIPIFTAITAVLMTVGFVLEWGLYNIAGWPQDLSGEQLYSSSTDLPMIFLAFWLRFLAWAGAGALIGAAFYRSGEAGIAALVLSAIPVTITGIALGDDWGPFRFLLDSVMDTPGDIPLAATIIAGLVSFLLVLVMAWRFVRDIPIRSRSS